MWQNHGMRTESKPGHDGASRVGVAPDSRERLGIPGAFASALAEEIERDFHAWDGAQESLKFYCRRMGLDEFRAQFLGVAQE